MKVVSGKTMQEIDRRAIKEFGIAGLTLMESAGRGCADAIIDAYGNSPVRTAVVFAGKGNNGGDGYVIHRLLSERGWEVTSVVLATRDEISGDAAVNLDRLPESEVCYCRDSCLLATLAQVVSCATVIVDALFGTGLGSEVSGLYAEAIEMINASGRPVIAVDIPSGVAAADGSILGAAVRADLTVTFAMPKFGHVLFPGAAKVGRLQVVDIGIPPQVMDEAPGSGFFDLAAARDLLRPRDRQAHKGSFGHLLIIAGSTGKSGAAAMAANSAVRAGAGLVTLAAPATLNPILEIKTTEAMTLPLPDGGEGYLGPIALDAALAAVRGKDAVAMGPGLSWKLVTVDLVRSLLAALEPPLVIDADALNIISDDPDILLRRKAGTVILTPHPGEMARLAGITIAQVEADRIGVARAFAEKYRVYLVLKGARTLVAAPDGAISINGSGNPGMASGGMGDVLTGVLGAMAGQGRDPFDACRLGVFIHGLAADLVAAEKGEIGMNATDVQERLPHAFNHILTDNGIKERLP